MAIIDDIIDSMEKAGKYVTDKAVDAKDYVKLEYKASTLKSEIERTFCELGKLTYDIKKKQSDDESPIAQCMEKIDVLKFRLKEVNTEMSKFKKTCPVCSKHAGASDTYCKNCGTKL